MQQFTFLLPLSEYLPDELSRFIVTSKIPIHELDTNYYHGSFGYFID